MSDAVQTEGNMTNPGQSEGEGRLTPGGGQGLEGAGEAEKKKYTTSRALLQRRLEKMQARSEARARGENRGEIRSSEDVAADETMERGKIAMVQAALESGQVGPTQELLMGYYEESLLTTKILGVVEKQAEDLAQEEGATNAAGMKARVEQLAGLKQVTEGDRLALTSLQRALKELGVDIAELNKAEEEARVAIESPEALGKRIADVETKLGRNKLAEAMTKAYADRESPEAKKVESTIQQTTEDIGKTGDWKSQLSTNEGLVGTAVTLRQIGGDVGLSLLGWFLGELQRQTNEAIRKM